MERQRYHRIIDRPAKVKDAGLMYQGGMTVRDIAKELDVSYGAAHRLIGESGVPFRKRSARRAA